MDKLDELDEGFAYVCYVVGDSVQPSMEEVSRGVCRQVTPGTRLGDVVEEIKFACGGGEMFRLSLYPPLWKPLTAAVCEYQCQKDETFYFNLRPSGKRTSAILKSPSTGSKRFRREMAVAELKPRVVDRGVILGHANDIMAALRWLLLLLEYDGLAVDLETLRAHRLEFKQKKRTSVPEADHYPGIRAFLTAASYGQAGLTYGGQGYGNSRRSDFQGMIQKPGESRGVMRSPVEVRMLVNGSTDRDPDGAEANAVSIKDVVDTMEGGEAVNLGLLFARMDRFWVVKYDRNLGEAWVTPYFPRAHSPRDTPQLSNFSDSSFELFAMRDIDAGRGRLKDVLPKEATEGFKTLVAFVEELRKLHGLEEAQVSFCSAPKPGESVISVSDLEILGHGRKSLVLLRRPTSSVLKVCEDASTEVNIHFDTDGHENLRKSLDWGYVTVGNAQVLHYTELEGYGEPFSARHLSTLEAMATMWRQARAGLRHIHEKGAFHRDLKPDNMLVFGGVLKINDYDLSCYKAEDDGRGLVGTPGYQSPSSRSPYTEDDDVLSLALAFYSAKEGQTPPLTPEGRVRILKTMAARTSYPDELKRDVQQSLDNLGL